jgi:hypothetical protein
MSGTWISSFSPAERRILSKAPPPALCRRLKVLRRKQRVQPGTPLPWILSDSWIRTLDYGSGSLDSHSGLGIRIRILLFLAVAFKMPKMRFFCLFLTVGTGTLP